MKSLVNKILNVKENFTYKTAEFGVNATNMFIGAVDTLSDTAIVKEILVSQ